MKSRCEMVAVVAGVMMAFVLALRADSFYVALGGNDASNGKSWATAKGSINGGASVATNAADELIISNGVYYLTNTVTVSKAITIRGVTGVPEDVVVDGTNTWRCFTITAAATLRDLTITHGTNSATGGGVSIAGGTVLNCRVVQNNCKTRGGGIIMTAAGTIQDCVIVSNRSIYPASTDGWGGGVLAEANNSTILGCTFQDNVSSRSGGGLYLASGFSTVSNCTFLRNVAGILGAGYSGGGISLVTGLVTGCSFVQNGTNTAGNGGGIAATVATVINCSFVSNTVANGGVGIYMSSTGVVDNCGFTNNVATATGLGQGYGGGGLQLAGGVVKNCGFSYNQAGAQGGGLYDYGTYPFTLTNCTFVGNFTANSGGGANLGTTNAWVEGCVFLTNSISGNLGGGLYMAGYGTLTNCSFVSNTCTISGGGAYLAANGTVDYCAFTNNRANGNNASYGGGGLFMAVGGTIRTSLFVRNHTVSSGGALRFQTDGLVVNCTFLTNTSTLSGGGVYMTGGTLQNAQVISNASSAGGGGAYLLNTWVTGGTFMANSASGGNGGGAIQLATSNTVVGCRFLSNSTTVNGGALQITGNGSVSNCVFIGNNAAGLGGAAYMNTATFSIFGSTMTSNWVSGASGGAMNVVAGKTVENCVLSYNYTSGTLKEGGAISAANTPVFRNCLIFGNTTSRMGGGIYASGGGVKVENCTIVGNQAGGSSSQGGGGVYGVSAVNTIVVSNTAPYNPDYYSVNCTFTNSCSPGLSGSENIVSDPKFVLAGSGYGASHVPGDYRLAKNSLCANKGTNLSWVATGVDLAGNPRLVLDRVDMGAYEQNLTAGGTFMMIR